MNKDNKQAIVTLVLGQQFQEMFNKWIRPGWEQYCSRYDLDLIVIDRPLDDSSRAQARSPAWQKCIIHRFPAVARYQQVAWVDADIRINPNSPNIFANVPAEFVGAVDAYAIPTREDYIMLLKRIYKQCEEKGWPYISNLTPQEYHGNFGLEAPFDGVVQSGVMVFSPQRHGEIFQKTYDGYEDKGDASWNYEMRPLSYEILKSGAIQWISPKFNMAWSYYELMLYPFLGSTPSRLQKLVDRIEGNSALKLRSKCVATVFQNNYFLHFAGGSLDYKLLPANAN